MAGLAVGIAGFPNDKLWNTGELSSWLYYISALFFGRYASIHCIAERLFRTCHPITMSDLVCPNEHDVDRNRSPTANCEMIQKWSCSDVPACLYKLAWTTSRLAYLRNVLLAMLVCWGRLLLFRPRLCSSSIWDAACHLYLLNFKLPVELTAFITPSEVL